MIKSENIKLKSNFDLEARILKPKNSDKAIVIAHQFRGSMNSLACFDAAQILSNNNYTTLSFDFLGHGKSGGPLRELSFETVSENVSDAIKYLRNQGYPKVGVYAISIGTIATALSKEKPDAQIFVNPAPLYSPKGLLERYSKDIENQKDLLEKEGYITATSGSGRGNFEMGKRWILEMQNDKGEIQDAYKKSRIPTLIIQGTEDPFGKDGLNFVKNFGGDYLEIEGADHDFTNSDLRKEAIEKAVTFFNKNLYY